MASPPKRWRRFLRRGRACCAGAHAICCAPWPRHIGGRIVLLALAILVANLAATAIPYLVGLGIDRGVPAVAPRRLRCRSWSSPALILVCALLQAFGYRVFVAGSGRIGQEILLELRERVFAHFQRLSLAFHERYTTGRMISRLTSDFESINDMFTLGLDTLINAVLSVVSVGVILLVLDLPLGLVCLSGFIPLWFLTRWYQRESTAAYRNTRTAMALVIVHFTESLRGIRAVHAFRRQPRNDEIFGELSEHYRMAMSRSFQLLGIYWPGIVLIGNLTTAAVLLYGGIQGHRPPDGSRGAGGLRALPPTVLRATRRGQPVLRLLPGAPPPGSRNSPACSTRSPACPMPERGAPLPAGG